MWNGLALLGKPSRGLEDQTFVKSLLQERRMCEAYIPTTMINLSIETGFFFFFCAPSGHIASS